MVKSLKPSIPVTEFPIRDTHPRTEDQLLVQELEDDPTFWDKMDEDDQSDPEFDPRQNRLLPTSKQSEWFQSQIFLYILIICSSVSTR